MFEIENIGKITIERINAARDARGSSRLTKEQVIEVCKKRIQGRKWREVAMEFGISFATVHSIWSGRSQKELTRELRERAREVIIDDISDEHRRIINDTSISALHATRETGMNMHLIIRYRKKYITHE